MTQHYSNQQVNRVPVYLDPATGYIPSDQVAPVESTDSIVIQVMALAANLADSETTYFGAMPVVPTTTAGTRKVYVPKSGTISKVHVYSYSSTAGSGEQWTVSLRLNDTTDHLVAAVSTASSERIFADDLAIAVVAGDFFEIKSIQPAWATNPEGTSFAGYVFIE